MCGYKKQLFFAWYLFSLISRFFHSREIKYSRNLHLYKAYNWFYLKNVKLSTCETAQGHKIAKINTREI